MLEQLQLVPTKYMRQGYVEFNTGVIEQCAHNKQH